MVVMTVEQFIDLLFAGSYWLVIAGFVMVALYAVYSRLRGGG
ncbi:MAG: hypothetical protein NZ921_04790 [Candidatus Caldarchaeum sp.]|nr:hypothetical protein [Candidatus Caldarchaeum sp.]MCX8201719.1 hypothetical protein [Candidatus Caldarchaeum sp.]